MNIKASEECESQNNDFQLSTYFNKYPIRVPFPLFQIRY